MRPGVAVDRYTVLDQLGEGGMARVYRVLHRHLGTVHVLKVLSSPSLAGQARLLREGQVQARLKHQNVVEVTDVIDVGGAPGLVMALVNGPSLERALTLGRLPESVVDGLAAQICAGLSAAHALGVVHRDLKPGNVLLELTDDAVVAKVADFGLVKRLDRSSDAQTASGATMGTPLYMAPEQIRGSRDVDQRSDVWALGAVLYEMATGRRAFSGATSYAVFEAVVAGRYARPASVDPHLPARWCAAIEACLAPLESRATTVDTVWSLWTAGEPPRIGWPSSVVSAWRTMSPAPVEISEAPATWDGGAASTLPLQAIRYQLPEERDAFVGRAADLEALAARLAGGSRLVTVLGFGGTGKTRLVTRYGWTRLADHPGGVWFCDLSEARDLAGVVGAVARGLEVLLEHGDPVVQLGHVIAARGRCLVLVDNAEQVTADVAGALGRWLDRSGEVAFVVTSREVLSLPGESVLALEPLGDDEAMALFTTRSRQVKPDFGAEEASATRALVRLLDGLPLAIELAAARSRVMSPSTLLARMSERFALLSSRGGRPGRHATLRGVLDWSWDLLSPDEQAALGQLSVFEGGFTLEAAEGVLSLGGGLWAADGVQALVDKSLVRQVGDGRFHLLASVHAYASEQLDTSADRASAEARHWAWFARMGTVEALDALDTHGGAARNAAMAREFDNLVLGCRRAAACGVGDVALALLRAVWAVLVLRGPLGPGLELAERVTGVSGLTGSGRGIVHRIRGAMLHRAGQPDEASVHFEAALAVARETGDRELESAATWYLGTVRRSQGRTTDAAAHYAEALAIAREMGDRWSERAILVSLGVLHLHQGRNDEARACLQAGLSAARASGDHRLQFIALGNLGNLEMSQGAHAEASASFEAALTVMRSLGDHRNEGVLLASLGTLNMIQGRSTQAQAAFERALEIARSVGLRSDEAFVLAGLGRLYLEQGRRAEAREHLVAALAVARETAYRRYEGSVLGALGELGREEGQLEASRADFDAGAAILRAASDRIELGRLLCGRALLRLATGDRAAAEEDLAEAETLTAEAGVGADAVLGRALAKARAEVGGATGTESA